MDAKKLLKTCGVDSAVFSTSGSHTDENFYYVTGLSKSIQISATAVLRKSGPVILTNRLEHALVAGKGKVVLIEDRSDAERAMKKYCGRCIGSDFSSVSAARLSAWRKILRGRKFFDISKQAGEARSVKSGSEIKKIKEACRIAVDTLGRIESLLGKCRTESELAVELEYAARKNGAEGSAFPPIVASGKNSAVAHHIPGKTKITNGVLLVDFGAVHDGYCSDITRMFSVGRADERLRHAYETVYSAQRAAINAIKNGAKACDVHAAADKILRESLGQKLIHSIGHGLGIGVHDCFTLNENPFIIKKGMVLTAEPGYYKPGWGGVRIEDDVLVRKRAVLLSRAPETVPEI